MKNLKTAVIILISLAVLITVSNIYLSRSSDNMAGIVSQAEKYASGGDTENAQSYLKDFQAKWEFHKHIYATFIEHEELDYANQSAAKLPALLKDDDKTEFLSECETLKTQLHHIEQTEQFSFDNIL